MRTNEIDLKLAILRSFNADVAQLAYASGDGVGHRVVLNDGVYYRTRGVDLLPGIAGGEDWPPRVDDLAQLRVGQLVAVDANGIHEFLPVRCAAKAFK